MIDAWAELEAELGASYPWVQVCWGQETCPHPWGHTGEVLLEPHGWVPQPHLVPLYIRLLFSCAGFPLCWGQHFLPAVGMGVLSPVTPYTASSTDLREQRGNDGLFQPTPALPGEAVTPGATLGQSPLEDGSAVGSVPSCPLSPQGTVPCGCCMLDCPPGGSTEPWLVDCRVGFRCCGVILECLGDVVGPARWGQLMTQHCVLARCGPAASSPTRRAWRSGHSGSTTASMVCPCCWSTPSRRLNVR